MTPETFVKCYPTAPVDVPELLPLLDAKTAWIEAGDEVAGRAADGTIVSLGSLYSRRDRLNLRSYLLAHPTPADW